MKKVNWKSIIGWTIAALVVVGIIGANIYQSWKDENHTKNIVKVGVLAPLSGEFGQLGHDALNGIQLALKEYNKSSPANIIMLNVKDGKARTSDSLSAFQQMLFSGIQALLVVGEPQRMAVASLATQHKIPTVVTLAGDSSLPNNTDRYVFLNFLSPRVSGKKIGAYATKIGLKNVAMLSMLSPLSQSWADGFKEGYKGNFIIHENFDNANRDNVRIQALKVLSKQPDGIFITGYGLPFSALLNAIKEQNYTGVLMADDYITDPGVTEFADPKNVICVQVKNRETGNDIAYQRFKEAYLNEYHKEPTLFSQYGYDSMRLILAGIQKGGSSAELIHQQILKINTFDTFAGTLEVLPDGTSRLPTFISKMDSEGKIVPVEE